jgi:hypothetical protein
VTYNGLLKIHREAVTQRPSQHAESLRLKMKFTPKGEDQTEGDPNDGELTDLCAGERLPPNPMIGRVTPHGRTRVDRKRIGTVLRFRASYRFPTLLSGVNPHVIPRQ